MPGLGVEKLVEKFPEETKNLPVIGGLVIKRFVKIMRFTNMINMNMICDIDSFRLLFKDDFLAKIHHLP